LCWRPCSNPREGVNSVLLDEAEAIRVRIRGDIDFIAPVVRCCQDRVNEAPGVQIREVRARDDSLGACFLGLA
jgi:hypothetical protein